MGGVTSNESSATQEEVSSTGAAAKEPLSQLGTGAAENVDQNSDENTNEDGQTCRPKAIRLVA